MAFITGIYPRLVFGIKNIDFQFLPLALKGKFTKAKKNINSIDFALFVPLLSGIALSFLIFSRVIHFALQFYPVPTFAFFFGLILASAKIVFSRLNKIGFAELVITFAGFLFAFVFSGLNPLHAEHSPMTVFLSGTIAVCAMILPGISGAFILLFLGQYEFLLGALHELNLFIIALFLAGAFVGIILFSRLLAYLLKTHRNAMMSFLAGLMLGALRIPVEKAAKATTIDELKLAIAAALAGIFIVLLIELIASNKYTANNGNIKKNLPN